VTQSGGFPETDPITAVRVAPDGVRVALIIGGASKVLTFGAIAAPNAAQSLDQIPPRSGQPAQSVPQITLSPFRVSNGPAGFSSVSWYGADNVVALGGASGAQGPSITEYSVNGASSTQIPTEAGIQSITASAGSELIAGTRDGLLMANQGAAAAWASIGNGTAPAYPG
jgi:lipoprotein LpqB-like beta-propeller protein